MPLYFFHLRNGEDNLLDPDGRDLDESAIPDAALKEARAIISHDVLGGVVEMHQYIEVQDESGAMVHRLGFKDAVRIE